VKIDESLIGFLCSEMQTAFVEEGQPVFPLKSLQGYKASRRM
jgi:hypothetical protein